VPGALHRRHRPARPAPPGVRSLDACARANRRDRRHGRPEASGVSVFIAADLPELNDPLPAHTADPGNPYVRLAEDVRLEDGRAFVIGAPARAISLAELARAALRDRSLTELGGPGLWATTFYAPPTVTWASGVHAAVVEVDVETGRLTIVRYVIVHDCGRQLHPVIVDGQIVGGFAQDLGVALGEHVVYDDAGQLLTSTLMEYPVPRADDMPPLVIESLHFHTDHNPLGVRGVGEGATGPRRR
jgi:CO/xanthine dehydrogenase Mo-binding subunit